MPKGQVHSNAEAAEKDSEKKRKRSSTSSANGDVSIKEIDQDIRDKYSPTQTKIKKKRKVKTGKTSKMDESQDTEVESSSDDIGKRLDSIMAKLDSIVKKEDIIEIVKSTFKQEMESMVEKIKEQIYNSVVHRIDVVESEAHKTNTELDKCKATIKRLQDDIQAQHEAITGMMRTTESNKGKCTKKGNEMEQYSRSNNIKIINLPEENGDRMETSDETTEKVIKFFKEKMTTDIQTSDIDIAHRLGKKLPNKQRTVIVKFLSRRHKFQCMKDRKTKLSGTGIYIVEDLTKMNQSVFTAARNHPEVETCWTRNGQVVIKWRANQRVEQILYNDYLHWVEGR